MRMSLRCYFNKIFYFKMIWTYPQCLAKCLFFKINTDYMFKNNHFSGSPVVKTVCFHSGGHGLIPGHGTEILHAARPKTKRQK